MKAVRVTIQASDVSRSPGITTNNYMLKDGGLRGFVSNGPRLQANDPEITVPDKTIDVVYNDGKCYKCDTKDFDVLKVYFAGTMGKCRKCGNNFVISSQMTQKEYENKFGLK